VGGCGWCLACNGEVQPRKSGLIGVMDYFSCHVFQHSWVYFMFVADFFDDVAVLYDTSTSIHELQHALSARISTSVEESVLVATASGSATGNAHHAASIRASESLHSVLHAVPAGTSMHICTSSSSGSSSTSSRYSMPCVVFCVQGGDSFFYSFVLPFLLW
jgi:hypothetical protein